MLDRYSRRYVIEHVTHINQDEVIRAIRRMKARKALPTVRSVTTDNGCEFLSQQRLDRVFGAETYYTRAYASYEKGTLVRSPCVLDPWRGRTGGDPLQGVSRSAEANRSAPRMANAACSSVSHCAQGAIMNPRSRSFETTLRPSFTSCPITSSAPHLSATR